MDDIAFQTQDERQGWLNATDEDDAATAAASATNVIAEMLRQPHRERADTAAGQPGDPFEENIRLKGLLEGYRAALDRHAIVAVTDPRGRIIFVNPLFSSVSGYEEGELLGRTHAIVNSGHHPREFFTDMWGTIARGGVWHGEICNRTKRGDLYWVDTTIVPLTDRTGRVEAYMSIRYDITRLKMAEAAQREEVERRRAAETLLADVIETVPDGIAAFDAEDRLVVYNSSYVQCFPASAQAITQGASFDTILRRGLDQGEYALARNSPEAREAWFRARLREHRNPGKRIVQELTDGRWIQIQERRSASGHIVGTRTDITELKRSEKAVKYHAEHDPLTGLLNRSVLKRHFSEAVENTLRSGRIGALLVLDLDDFKHVNDAMGHPAGDALLIEISRRLSRTLRRADSVVRLGGDEFAIILPQLTDRSEITKAVARLKTAMEKPFVIQRRTLIPKSSIGVAVFPRHGRKLPVLLRKADLALYRAKAEGDGGFRIFSRSMQARIEQRRRLREALCAAVASEKIEIALQPQFILDTRAHSGFEVLARWTRNGKPVPPSEFIAVAEESGLIGTIGRQVMDLGLRSMRSLRQQGLYPGTLAVNIAAEQIRSPDFPHMFEAMTRGYRMSPADIEIELTENILLDHAGEQIAQSLHMLRAMGFTIALDDFGTGYASLSHLSRFPVDRIKIDRGFVAEMCGGGETCTIVRATIELAHALGMKVVAEGIETQDQLDRLRLSACDFGQGYLVSRPLHPQDLADYLNRERKLSERND